MKLKAYQLIILINVIYFIVMSIAGGTTNAYTLIRFGVLRGDFVLGNGQWYRVITSMFIHIGFLHIFFNMYALYFLGSIVEGLFGKEKFLFIYFFSGVIGNLLSLLFYYNSMSAGASGAIFGLSGFLLVYGLYRKDTLLNLKSFAMSAILPFVLFNVILGFIPHSHINNAAHLGGLLAGGVLALFIYPNERFSYKRQTVFHKMLWTIAISIIAVVLLVSFYQMTTFAKVDVQDIIVFNNSINKILSEYTINPQKAIEDANFLQAYDKDSENLKSILITSLKNNDIKTFVIEFTNWRNSVLKQYKGIIGTQ
jgi:rhomboid protease GluP